VTADARFAKKPLFTRGFERQWATVRLAVFALAIAGSLGCGRIAFDPASGSADAAIDALDDSRIGVPVCPYLFCNGFEGSADETPWTSSVENGGTLGQVTSPAQSGSFARINMVATPTGQGFDMATLWSGQKTGDVFIRAYFYVPTGAVTVHVDVLAIASNPDLSIPPVHVGIVNSAIGIQNSVNAMTYLGGTIPRDRWFCYELHVALSVNATGAIEQFIDGTLDLPIPDVPTVLDVGISHFGAGVLYAQDPVPVIYTDDVVVSSSRIGC